MAESARSLVLPPQATRYERGRSGDAILMRRAPGLRLNLHCLFQVGKSHDTGLVQCFDQTPKSI